MIRPNRIGVISAAPILMTWSERVVLYSTIIGLRPRRSLGVGIHKGGSAVIIVAALDDLGEGSLVCVDPNPMAAPEHWHPIVHRATLVAGGSPEVLPQANEASGGRFDFATIDGDHETSGVIRDIEGVLPLLEGQADVLFHDAHFVGVRNGIDQMLRKYSGCLVDWGLFSVVKTPDAQPGVVWGGLRLLKFSRRKAVAA